MAELRSITCDNCGKVKGENNHWWKLVANIKERVMFICPFSYDIHNISLMKASYKTFDACGLECLGILESKVKEGK